MDSERPIVVLARELANHYQGQRARSRLAAVLRGLAAKNGTTGLDLAQAVAAFQGLPAMPEDLADKLRAIDEEVPRGK